MLYRLPVFLILLFFSTGIHPGSFTGKVIKEDTRLGTDLSSPEIAAMYAQLGDTSLNRKAFGLAIQGYGSLCHQGLVNNDSLLTLIDYSLPSSSERLFVISLPRKVIVCKSLVAHGRNSGDLFARHFSNISQSHQSALGFFLTGSTYLGTKGYSMLLIGLEKGFNDNALSRGIVIHGARYATRTYTARYGRLGRSFGCPALPPSMARRVIGLIKDGSVLFCYYPDSTYLGHSGILPDLSGNSTGIQIPR
jgi:hypothetical protein